MKYVDLSIYILIDVYDFPKEDLKFVQPNEANVKPQIFDRFRASSISDLTLFLQLRADELCDNGQGLFLMVGGGSLGYDDKNKLNPYGGQTIGFLNCQKGSILKEAFENAIKDPQFCHIAKDIHKAHLAAFCPYFLRCESDVMESFSHVNHVLELRELKWENCLINSGSPEKLVDFVWSITGHSIEESIKVHFQLI